MMVILTGVRSGSLDSFNSGMALSPPSAAVGAQHQVLVNDDAQRPARPHGDGRLDVEVALGDPLAGTVGVALRGLANGPQEIALVLAEGQLGADAEQRSEEHTSELQSLMRISYAVFCLKTHT